MVEKKKPLLLLFAFKLACSDFTAKYQFTTIKRKNVTQELEILQSSAACSTTSSLDVVSNKVRLLEKKKPNKTKHDVFWLLSFPVGI